MRLLLFILSISPLWSQASLHGVVTDPSGAAVPDATVRLSGTGGERRVKTPLTGEYSFPKLAPGRYQLQVVAKGFSVAIGKDLTVDGAAAFDVHLTIQTAPQSVRVEGRNRGVSIEPESNGSAVVMREAQIAQLADDPDELALQLQALAGPAPGPNGGQLYVDGFSGGSLPPKSSIREIRINSNPFAPEYDRPGFARVEVFTKPGSDTLRGQAMTQQNSDVLNARNPLLGPAAMPPYRAQIYGAAVGGPLRKNRGSYLFDVQRRRIGENAVVLASTPDGRLNQTLPTPQSRTAVSPRVDWQLDARNSLTARYQQIRSTLENLGVGDFALASRAYREQQREQTLQLTETATLSPRWITETRYQYLRSSTSQLAGLNAPAIDVVGAFSSGGSPIGNSGAVTSSSEISNLNIYTRGRHIVKWGARFRESRLTDTSRNNFAGTFTFYTLGQFQAGTPAQFSLNAGNPTANVGQSDAGLFVGDDWRLSPTLTVSFGLRYEAQTNFGGLLDFAPRLSVAWALDARTVLRTGAGSFYDRVPTSVKLNQERFDGVSQQSYLIPNPAFYPTVPAIAGLAAGRTAQQLRPVAAGLATPRLYQASLGIERQLNQQSKLSVSWIESRGVHLANIRNINTPLEGAYPFGDASIRLLTESAGMSRQRQVVANVNATWRSMFVFGYYALSYGKDNNEGLPADPYNLRAEWGPSTYGDMRHRAALGITLPLPGKLSLSPFLVANSGLPYNITTGLDPLGTGSPTQRPGTPMIERNSGRGPGAFNIALRLGRTWQFGREVGATETQSGSSHDGPPAGMFATGATRRYQLTLSASTLNALNRANYGPPNGDMSSAYFGQSRSLGGLIVMNHGGAPTTYNRKIDLAVRFTF